MTINFVLCNASLDLHRERSYKQRSLPQSFSLLNEEDHYREADTSDSSKGNPENLDDEEDNEGEPSTRGTNFKRRNWKEVRPDILHFCLLALHDSILNKEGKISIWVHTLNSQLYRIYPEFRIPRTFKVFNKVMAKYLHSNARCLKPEGDDSTVLVERVDERLDDLGRGGVKVAVSSRGRLSCAEEFFKQGEVASRLDDLWIYVSLSNYTPLPVPDESGIVSVAEVHKKLVERSDRTPAASTYSQDIERKMIASETSSTDLESSFDYNISISRWYPTAMSTCYKLVCALERTLDL